VGAQQAKTTLLSGLQCCLAVNLSTLLCFSAPAQVCWRVTSLVPFFPVCLAQDSARALRAQLPRGACPKCLVLPGCSCLEPLSSVAGFVCCLDASSASPSWEGHQLALGKESRAASRGAGIAGSAALMRRGSGQPVNWSEGSAGLQQPASASRRGKQLSNVGQWVMFVIPWVLRTS